MRPGPKLAPLDLTAGERVELERWVRRRKGAQDMALRARLVLACDAVAEDGFPVSTKVVAEQVGLSQSTVSLVWRAFGLQPHRSETFMLSTDPFFVDKVRAGGRLSPGLGVRLEAVSTM